MGGKKQAILVVEDESSIASFVGMYLKRAGFIVRVADTGGDALEKASADPPALIILDLMLPDLDGIDVCRRIRQRSDVPILMLSARDEDIDKIIGLEVGADDYLTKPFSPRELVARIKAVLRRSTSERQDRETEVIQHGDLRIDTGRHEAYDKLVDKVMSVITDLKQMETYSSPAQIAEVVYEAATDGKDQLRYVAGEDAKATYAMRLQVGDEAFRNAMNQQFFGG